MDHLPLRLLIVCVTIQRLPTSTLFPYTTLFRSPHTQMGKSGGHSHPRSSSRMNRLTIRSSSEWNEITDNRPPRSEEHTSELQSHHDLVCRLLLEKKKRRQGGGD